MSYNRDADEALGKKLSVYGDNQSKKDGIEGVFRLKRPCGNCPFRKKGAIELSEGRLEGIVEHLMENDSGSFHCHKTVHSKLGGEFDDEGDYLPSGSEAMCAGAAAYLMKKGRPTIGMRLAFMSKAIPVSHWDEAKDMIIDDVKSS